MAQMKSPITILQEIMRKKQEVPIYDLIVNQGGTHINTFVYKVSCDRLVATGRGRSKREAKHNAANALLEAITRRELQQIITTTEPLNLATSPSPLNEQIGNPVNDLQIFCSNHNLNKPEYQIVMNEYENNRKISTIQCNVIIPTEIGTAETQELAKQEAAGKMLNKLKTLMFDVPQENTRL
ncbi:RISC-loading complex subunit tarbp2-like [Ceratina calcarata]|uniref:RISC-loading complex subunit tarbp2-like n=1 Tax=Ceratina calcarata TaxID=156304 RepID=A0AAJ7JHJ5_9HYME|nr:RISC-loading complex subunit tarbp2-like [Ceratina calcarata]